MGRGRQGHPERASGSNRWPATHTLDAARAYRLALESAPGGSRLHAVADEGVPFREIAEVIGRELELPSVSVAPEDAGEHFSYLGNFVSLDNPISSELTRELLGREPTHEGPDRGSGAGPLLWPLAPSVRAESRLWNRFLGR
jgi:nucleoside-diphosphate-sugar epimerase